GAACQLGRLPFKLESLEEAIARTVPAEERAINLQAFNTGRALVVRPGAIVLPNDHRTYAALLTEKKKYLQDSYGRAVAEDYRNLVEEAVLELAAGDELHRDFALRVYDLVHYEGLALARRYVDLVLATASQDRREWGRQ